MFFSNFEACWTVSIWVRRDETYLSLEFAFDPIFVICLDYDVVFVQIFNDKTPILELKEK